MGNTFITKDGKKVSLNETFRTKYEKKIGDITCSYSFYSSNLTFSQAKMLIKDGILKEIDAPKTEKAPTLTDAVNLIGKWIMGENAEKEVTMEFLSVMPDYARFSVILRAMAVLIDRKYPDHINNADVDKYYTIDMSNGRVCEVPKGRIKNFRNFAAFRTLEDIKMATKVLRPFIKKLWPSE